MVEKSEKGGDPVRRWTLIVLGVIVGIFLYSIIADRMTPYTSQAIVQAYVVRVAPEVSGRVLELGVADNQKVKAGELLSMVARQAAPLMNQAGLRLDLQQDGELPTIYVDSQRIMRVFGNVLDNAIKFTDAGGVVTVRAEPAPGAVLFSIANSGPAVPQQDLARLFLPFWQARSDDARGAGLGLSICRSIIEAHGGTVWAEPMAGMRLKIVFLLPRGRPQPPLAEEMQAGDAGS